MKLAYTISGIYNSGGMENILLQKANYLADVLGYDVTIITTDQDGRASFFPISSRIHLIDLGINYHKAKPSRLWHLKKLILKRKHKKSLNRLLKTSGYDICISLMDFDFSFLHSIKDGSRKIVEFHFSRYAKALATTNKIKSILQRFRTLVWKRILNKYSRFVVLTERDKQQWEPLANVTVIPNFISTYPDQYADVRSKRVISVGRYDYQKGFDMLLPAWGRIQHKLPDWELVIFGGGDRSMLECQIENEGLERITLSPPTQHIDKEYQKSGFYVLSSRYEGLPMVLLEAMSYGLPVVSFDCACGPSDVLTPEFSKLVPAEDVDKLSQSILDVASDDEWREHATKGAVKHSQLYSKDKIMARWDDLFKSVAGY